MEGELDRLLDEALASYGRAPERAGLEGRVLGRATKTNRRRIFRPAVVCAVCALVVALFFWPQGTEAPPELVTERSTVKVVVSVKPPSERRFSQVGAASFRRRRRRSVEPKLREFPSQLPMTNQERALVRLAETEPTKLTQLHEPVEPIAIALIKIEPLE